MLSVVAFLNSNFARFRTVQMQCFKLLIKVHYVLRTDVFEI